MSLKVDSRQRFSATVDLYKRYRPTYPPALFDWLVADLPPHARIADLGCGTGIATRLLAERGFEVIGIDPNQEMLAEARRRAQRGAGAAYQRGEAAATGLDRASVDLVCAGQAFHWFDLATTMPELARILRPGGRAAAFWNVRAKTPAMGEYEALLRRHSSEYGKMRGPGETLADLRAWPTARELEEIELAGRQSFDREGFRGRVYSSSYVVHGVEDKAAFDRELDALFDRHAVAGVMAFPYRVLAIRWRF